MNILNENEFTVFKDLVQMTQNQLISALPSVLKDAGYKEVVATKDYVYAVGKIPICLTAHMDTVFKTPAKEVFYDREQNVIWSPTGLGADDRAGIFIILQILKSHFRPHICFCADEEIGSLGAMAIAARECPFKNLKYVIELDRRGTNDCVYYDCDNPDFNKYIESYGFIEALGSFSDICELCPEWRVSGVNLSVGYRDEHSTSELLFVQPMLNTLTQVKKMLKNGFTAQKFPFIERVEPYWMRNYHYGDYYNEKKEKCHSCGKYFGLGDLFPVKLLNGKTEYYCIDCAMDNVEWCEKCGSAFEIDPKNPKEKLCEECRKNEQRRTI